MLAPQHDIEKLALKATEVIRSQGTDYGLAYMQYIVGLQDRAMADSRLWLQIAEVALDGFYFNPAKIFIDKLLKVEKKLSVKDRISLHLFRSRLGQFIADDKIMTESLKIVESLVDKNNTDDWQKYQRRAYHVALHLLKKGASVDIIKKSFASVGWRKNMKWELSFKELPYHLSIPEWQGQDLQDDETLLVSFEQGFGDQIQFSRFIAMIYPKAKRILLEAHPDMYRCFADQFDGKVSGAEVLAFPYGQFDKAMVHPRTKGWQKPAYRVFFYELPQCLGVPSPAVPMPYLSFDKAYRGNLPPRPVHDKKKVGLVWACGTIGHSQERSIALKNFVPLLSLPAIEWWSLQMPPQNQEIYGTALQGLFKNNMSQVKDFADTARMLYYLDAVVTVDTAMAHLALAFGLKTIVLIPYIADWRWKGAKKNGDSIWYGDRVYPIHYPRFHEGKTMPDWQGVIKKLQPTLQEILS